MALSVFLLGLGPVYIDIVSFIPFEDITLQCALGLQRLTQITHSIAYAIRPPVHYIILLLCKSSRAGIIVLSFVVVKLAKLIV